MPTQLPVDFLTFSKWSGILTVVCFLAVVLAFIFNWGTRFRLVGITGFMGVLTVGLFALGFGFFSRIIIPGSSQYTVVYDNGGNQTVIAVSPEITESGLESTLEQASSDLFSLGRSGGTTNQLLIRARTIIHPEPGVSKPLYLGQIKRSLAQREDPQVELEVFSESFAEIPATTPVKETAS